MAAVSVAQRSLDDLGTPLADVTFCVIDLETTGGSPADDAITEIGAVRVRGGEVLGELATLVDPGRGIPAAITVLTGITESMVVGAPRLEAVLGTVVDFIGGAVVVGHNVRFDLGFLSRALARHGWPALTNPTVDTCSLARRLVRDEVPNCRLGTLADRLRLPRRPTHRALDDARATVDLLHVLLERAAGHGVLGLDDLLGLPRAASHPQAAKLALTARLPRSPGVYLFRGAGGRVLYVGKATDLRRRVRSYFASDDRRKVGALLREARAIDHLVCSHPLEAAVVEARLIRRHLPPYNSAGTRDSAAVHVRLTDEAFPRLSIVRRPGSDTASHLGPLPSRRTAQTVLEALWSASRLRRCTRRVGTTPCPSPCVPAQLGVAPCPCAGGVDAGAYALEVDRVRRALRVEPQALLEPLAARMRALARAERYEEAAVTRDRAAALAEAWVRTRRLESLVAAGRVVVRDRTGWEAEIDHGLLVGVRTDGGPGRLPVTPPTSEPPAPGRPVPAEAAGEVGLLAGWLERTPEVRVVSAEGPLASHWPRPRALRAAPGDHHARR